MRGEKPGNLSVKQPAKFDLVIGGGSADAVADARARKRAAEDGGTSSENRLRIAW